MKSTNIAMTALQIERAISESTLDVLDRVLDKGIVIDGWSLVSLAGLDLLAIEARVVVTSIETYLNYADRVSHTALRARAAVFPRFCRES